jgi:ATP-dependent DNA helicase PIF1
MPFAPQVDNTLRDVCDAPDIPFGGMPVVFAGDFGQTLPIVKHGGPEQQVAASLCGGVSHIWAGLRHLQLTDNVRVQRLRATDDSNAARLQAWEDLLLRVRRGEGTQPFIVPPEMRVHDRELETLLTWVFGDVATNGLSDDAMLHRAVLTPLRSCVDRINAIMLARMHVPQDQQRAYIAADEVVDAGDPALHGPDVLCALQPDGLPTHTLHLKVGMPVMVMRNISGVMGLVNGTRLRVTALHAHCVQGSIITGRRQGQAVLIPRILLESDDDKLPFQIRRLQLPLQPCFAMTINKAQGQTLQRVGLWLPTPCFAHGQLYVALSRCGDPANVRVLVQHPRVSQAPAGDEGDWATANVVSQDVLLSVVCALAGNVHSGDGAGSVFGPPSSPSRAVS